MIDLGKLVEEKNAVEILKIAKQFHGHICPYLALGIRASLIAMEELGVGRLDSSASIEESTLAIVETNNCFTDGVQVTTGCTLGNNSLVYLDLGKTALTLVKRGNWEGVRVCIDPEKLEDYYPPEATELFRKVVKERKGTEEDRKRLNSLWEETGRRMLEVPRQRFKIQRVRIKPIEQAPIFESVRCSKCGEVVSANRVIYLDGRPLCLRCAGRTYRAIIGRGITETEDIFIG